jgi:hypothetical protein
VKHNTVRLLANRGTIPSIKLSPRLIRFSWPAVLEAMEKFERSAVAV